MKQKSLLMLAVVACSLAAQAQKRSANVTAYAITAVEKGGSRWAEVKLVDMVTGQEIQSVYESKSEVPVLNARTKKPIEKKDITGDLKPLDNIMITRSGDRMEIRELRKVSGNAPIVEPQDGNSSSTVIRCVKVIRSDAPFATNSAACAYDKKHNRLYYTPMGINQLRYIDLRSSSPTIYYFEDEPLGALSGPGDVQNQVTRMTIASDGNGYALTNNGEHLVRFTTNKKATISDLGALTDDVSNGKYSIHSRKGYGGDMVADDSKNLFVITGNRMVFKVDIKTLVATYKGTIKGLPNGFTTNGAAVEHGNNIIVSSATTATAYYKFSLDNLQAEKISTGSSVFNAADLANGNLVKESKKKKADEKPVAGTNVEDNPGEEFAKTGNPLSAEIPSLQKIRVYPNPVSNGPVKIAFDDFPAGRYELELVDLNGKTISAQTAQLNSKAQVLEYKLPSSLPKGTYLLKVMTDSKKVLNTEKIIVQ